MESVPELVEERARVLERKKRRRARAGLGEIHHVVDDRVDVAGELLPGAEGAHPGAAPLRGSREIVAEKEADMTAVRVGHFPGADVGVVDGDVVPRRECEPEKPARGVERGGDHVLELQIGLDPTLVEIELSLAPFLRVVAPVPWGEREIAALGLDQALQRVAFAERLFARRPPDGLEQAERRFRRLRHRVVEAEGSIGLVAEEVRAFDPELDHLDDDRGIVGGAAVLAPRDPRLEARLAKVAPAGELQERLDRGAGERDCVLAFDAARLRRGCRCVAHGLRQSGEVGFAIQHERVSALVGKHILAELGAERRLPLGDLGEPPLLLRREGSAVSHEGDVQPLQYARLLLRQRELRGTRLQCVDATEKRLVLEDRRAVLGEDRRHVALDLLQVVVRVRAGKPEEDRGDPPELFAAKLQRFDRVGEAWRLRVRGDRRDLHVVLRQRRVEGGSEMLRPHLRKGR